MIRIGQPGTPYETEVITEVIASNATDVILAETPFVPETAERVGDLGVIGGRPVRNVRCDDGTVVHRMADCRYYPALEPGQQVAVEIDWARRYRTMRLNTGVHLAWFGFLATHGPAVSEKRWVGEVEARIRLRPHCGPGLARDLWPGLLASWLRRAVTDDLAITSSGRTGDRLHPYWHVDGIGTIACRGLHPWSTSEVGPVDLRVDVERTGSITVSLSLAEA